MNPSLRAKSAAVAAFALTLLTVGAARADETSPPASEEDQTLIGSNVRHGGYGAPEVKVSSFTGDTALFVGGQAGWIVNRRFILGAAGYGLATSHSPAEPLLRPDGPSRIGFGYGGVRLAYVVRPESVIHLTLGCLVGAGGVTVVTHNIDRDRYDSHDSAAVFALEPSAELELNVARLVRVATGLSYRYISDADRPGMHSSDLSGVAGSLAVKVGVF